MREQIINTPSSADTELYNSTESVASGESQYYEPEDCVPSVATDNDEAKGSVGDGEAHDGLPKQLANLEISRPYKSDNADQNVAPELPELPGLPELTVPITSRDFLNATPRPSPRGTPRASLSKAPSTSLASDNIEQSSSGSVDSRAINGGTLGSCLDVATAVANSQSTVKDRPTGNNLSTGNDQSAGYDIERELLFNADFFDPKFQNALKSAKKLTGSIDDQLSQCALVDGPSSDLFKTREIAKRYRNFDCPAKRTIGLVGHSGEGKSTFGGLQISLMLSLREKQSHQFAPSHAKSSTDGDLMVVSHS